MDGTEDQVNGKVGGLLSIRRIARPEQADACFFRSRAEPGRRKALLQITERCDLHCAHCFVAATRVGRDMDTELVSTVGVARLQAARVANVTLTGGEPFAHPEVVEIATAITAADMAVTICTNAVSITTEQIERLAKLGRVSVNVSLDGTTPESHGRFRGDRDSFEATLQHTRELGAAGLLKGILSTPNALASPDEYVQLHVLARELGAEYLLMNPLSSFGRGVFSFSRLRATDDAMKEIETQITSAAQPTDPEAVFIRFPNETKPLTSCIAGEVVYVFVDGDTAICPYLVFAARTPKSKHKPEEFIAANLFRDPEFDRRLDEDDFHTRYQPGSNSTCAPCSLNGACGKGCPAAVIASGAKLGEVDTEVCPVASSVDQPAAVS